MFIDKSRCEAVVKHLAHDITIAESGKTVFKDGAYVTGVAGISAANRNADHVTFDVGSGVYSFRMATGTGAIR